WLRRVDSPALTRLALERHFPNHLIDALMEGRLTQAAREKHTRSQTINVLFSDVRDYTTLSEVLKAAGVLDLVNDWFAESQCVVRLRRLAPAAGVHGHRRQRERGVAAGVGDQGVPLRHPDRPGDGAGAASLRRGRDDAARPGEAEGETGRGAGVRGGRLEGPGG